MTGTQEITHANTRTTDIMFDLLAKHCSESHNTGRTHAMIEEVKTAFLDGKQCAVLFINHISSVNIGMRIFNAITPAEAVKSKDSYIVRGENGGEVLFLTDPEQLNGREYHAIFIDHFVEEDWLKKAIQATKTRIQELT